MLRRRLPSANSIFTFEVVARLGSFSDAAKELNVTQPAVSHAISGLEQHLGYGLFNRHGRWIELTHNGDRLFRTTSAAFESVSDTLREIGQQREDNEIVSLSMSSTAVNFWFIPRLPAFKDAFPNVCLNFHIHTGDGEDAFPTADLCVRLSGRADTNLHRWPFSDEKIMALCSPEYLAKYGSLDTPAAGQSHTLIEEVTQRYTLDEFFHATGQTTPKNHDFIKFSDYSSIIQAAIRGQGIALAWVPDTSYQVIDGTLVPACTQIVKTGRRYHILASNLTPMRPIVEEIRDWLIHEMRSDQKKMTEVFRANWDLF